jgi:hypothetical protein
MADFIITKNAQLETEIWLISEQFLQHGAITN